MATEEQRTEWYGLCPRLHVRDVRVTQVQRQFPIPGRIDQWRIEHETRTEMFCPTCEAQSLPAAVAYVE